MSLLREYVNESVNEQFKRCRKGAHKSQEKTGSRGLKAPECKLSAVTSLRENVVSNVPRRPLTPILAVKSFSMKTLRTPQSCQMEKLEETVRITMTDEQTSA